jgi:hypothetical protein
MGLSISLQQLKFKVTEITQEKVNHLHMAFLKGVSGTISK